MNYSLCSQGTFTYKYVSWYPTSSVMAGTKHSLWGFRRERLAKGGREKWVREPRLGSITGSPSRNIPDFWVGIPHNRWTSGFWNCYKPVTGMCPWFLHFFEWKHLTAVILSLPVKSVNVFQNIEGDLAEEWHALSCIFQRFLLFFCGKMHCRWARRKTLRIRRLWP